jgi:hypothetical protein
MAWFNMQAGSYRAVECPCSEKQAALQNRLQLGTAGWKRSTFHGSGPMPIDIRRLPRSALILQNGLPVMVYSLEGPLDRVNWRGTSSGLPPNIVVGIPFNFKWMTEG